MAKKSLKLPNGTVYQKTEGGTFYFRYQLNGVRKAVSLKTKSLTEAKEKAKEILPVINASSLEVVAAHVSHVNFGLTKQELKLSDVWLTYDAHPERADPETVAEQDNYKRTWDEFTRFVSVDIRMDDVTHKMAMDFANHLKKQKIAVDTHNRKIRRLAKVFSTLDEYYKGDNPFKSSILKRKAREEQSMEARRRSFSKEQEIDIIRVLNDPSFTVINKDEVKTLYYIGMFTGQRLKDCALLQWDKVNLERRRIWVKQFKTGTDVSFPMAEELYEELLLAKDRVMNSYVLPDVAKRYMKTDDRGKNIGGGLVNTDVMRVIRWIGLEPSEEVSGRKRKVTVYGFHSLRHSFASHCAEAGVPKAVVVSILGASSDIVDKYYTHVGEEAQEQAVELISLAKKGTVSATEKIERVMKYINSKEELSADMLEVKKLLS